MKCIVGPLKRNEEVWVAFRSRAWVPTIKKMSTGANVNVSSFLTARVVKLPHIGTPDSVSIRTHEVFTQLVPTEPVQKPEVIPLWVVVLSACAGALILMLLVYVLWKVGFFKRNRPTNNTPEKQPLTNPRNGHFHPGDEAL